jgi:hypothetical protein
MEVGLRYNRCMTVIPASYRVVKTARIYAEMPEMAKYPPIFKAFVDAVLADEWGKARTTSDIQIEIVDGMVHITFVLQGYSPVNVDISITELVEMHQQIGAILGV